jgi:hypothetical protein
MKGGKCRCWRALSHSHSASPSPARLLPTVISSRIFPSPVGPHLTLLHFPPRTSSPPPPPESPSSAAIAAHHAVSCRIVLIVCNPCLLLALVVMGEGRKGRQTAAPAHAVTPRTLLVNWHIVANSCHVITGY